MCSINNKTHIVMKEQSISSKNIYRRIEDRSVLCSSNITITNLSDTSTKPSSNSSSSAGNPTTRSKPA